MFLFNTYQASLGTEPTTSILVGNLYLYMFIDINRNCQHGAVLALYPTNSNIIQLYACCIEKACAVGRIRTCAGRPQWISSPSP